MNVAILTTTIHVPLLLRDYCENARAHNHRNVSFVVVEDMKTPPETALLCRELQGDYGYSIADLTVDFQDEYLRGFPGLATLIPWRTIQRRNVGLLYALEQGCDVVISIDDDNYLLPGRDFVSDHCSGLGDVAQCDTVTSETGWFNCMEMMQTNCGTAYPRGFPLSKRWLGESVEKRSAPVRCVVNAGLWAGDPDVDALTRIYRPIASSLPLTHERLALGRGTWCPVNSQNTAFHANAAAAAFLFVMGREVDGIAIDRYDDIWMSWMLQAIAEHLGDTVRFGQPVVRQARNEHDLFVDLRGELPGMMLNEALIEACRSCSFTGSTYLECYRELAEHVARALSNHPQSDLFAHLRYQMLTWAAAAERVTPDVTLALAA